MKFTADNRERELRLRDLPRRLLRDGNHCGGAANYPDIKFRVNGSTQIFQLFGVMRNQHLAILLNFGRVKLRHSCSERPAPSSFPRVSRSLISSTGQPRSASTTSRLTRPLSRLCRNRRRWCSSGQACLLSATVFPDERSANPARARHLPVGPATARPANPVGLPSFRHRPCPQRSVK